MIVASLGPSLRGHVVSTITEPDPAMSSQDVVAQTMHRSHSCTKVRSFGRPQAEEGAPLKAAPLAKQHRISSRPGDCLAHTP